MGDSDFLEIISRITGIPGLIYDPQYLGGGIKVSFNSVFLPRHIDFNYHQSDPFLLRCLNLLFYFNPDWKEEWGGNIQVHHVPKQASDNTLVAQYTPVSGRLFMFETCKISYHGFDEIKAEGNPGRKSFGVYFYRKVSEEDAPSRNTTMYIEPGLPEQFKAGRVILQQDILELQKLFIRRDDRINDLYRRLNEREAEIQTLLNHNKKLRKSRERRS